MKTLLVNGNVITGDGKTVLRRASVLLEDWYISQVTKLPYVYDKSIGSHRRG